MWKIITWIFLILVVLSMGLGGIMYVKNKNQAVVVKTVIKNPTSLPTTITTNLIHTAALARLSAVQTLISKNLSMHPEIMTDFSVEARKMENPNITVLNIDSCLPYPSVFKTHKNIITIVNDDSVSHTLTYSSKIPPNNAFKIFTQEIKPKSHAEYVIFFNEKTFYPFRCDGTLAGMFDYTK